MKPEFNQILQLGACGVIHYLYLSLYLKSSFEISNIQFKTNLEKFSEVITKRDEQIE